MALLPQCTPPERDFRDQPSDPDASAGRQGSANDVGGQGGKSSTPPDTSDSLPLLTTKTLPDGEFNAPYHTELTIKGAGPFSLEVSEGHLPDGLTLSQSGRISGVPKEHGSFTFAIVVSNDTEHSEPTQLSLFVSRKHWLLYSSDEDEPGQADLYAIDTTRTLLQPITLTKGLAGTVSEYEFAASGDRLGFTMKIADNAFALYIINVAQDKLSDAFKLDADHFPSEHFALAPSGNGVAYTAEVEAGAWELRFQDLTELESDFIPITSLAPEARLTELVWVDEQRIIYGITSLDQFSLHTRVLSGKSFGPEVALEGRGANVHRALNRATTGLTFAQCQSVRWLYDFTDGRVTGYRAPAGSAVNWPVFSPDLNLVTLRNESGGRFVFDATSTDGEPIGLISPTGGCTNLRWSPNSDRLVTTSANDESLQLTVVADAARTYPIEGGYEFTRAPGMAFANNERFLFSDDDEIWEVRIHDDVPLPASIIVPADSVGASNGASIRDLVVSLNGEWAYYTAAAEPLLVALPEEPIPTPRRVRFGSGGTYSEATFSPDSSTLACVATSESGKSLYVTDLLHPTAFGVQVGGGAQVLTFQFQP